MQTVEWNRMARLPHLLWLRHKCPRCASVQFKPAELRSFDAVLSLFFLRPVRCGFCWRRYYWFSFRATDQI